ncbi:MAG: hypothetical protein ABEJ72_04330 [Candidatus Aenigmatarchaeota archaeon]
MLDTGFSSKKAILVLVLGAAVIPGAAAQESSHEGKYLYLGANLDTSPDTMRFGFLSDKKWHGGTGAGVASVPGNQPAVLVRESDPGLFSLNQHDDWSYSVDSSFSISGNPDFNQRGLTRHNTDGTNDNVMSQAVVSRDWNKGLRWELRDPGKATFYGNEFNEYVNIHPKGSDYFTGSDTEELTVVGEIRPGKELVPQDGSKARREEPKFHICREENTVLPVNQGIIENLKGIVTGDIEPTGKVIESGNQLYKCDTSINRWKQVDRCSDGIDTDGNGRIDRTNPYPAIPVNPECGGRTPGPGPESGQDGSLTTATCEPYIGRNDQGEKVAYYNGKAEDNTLPCNYQTEPLTAYSGSQPSPVTVGCEFTGKINGDNDEALKNYCERISKDSLRDVFFHSEYYDNIVKIVKFHVPPSAVPTRSENSDLSSQFVRDSGDRPIGYSHSKLTGRSCVADRSEGGFVNTRCQTLHEAEYDYRGSTDTGTFGVENPHATSTWKDRNMTQLQGYENDNPVKYQNAWTVGNALGSSNDKIYTPPSQQIESIASQGVFKGGFAGKCDTGQKWRYSFDDERWECSGEINWRHRYFIPKVDGGPNTEVGVFIDKDTFNSGNKIENLESIWLADKGESLDVTHVDVMCFNGKSFDPDMPDSRYFKKRVEVPDTVDKPFFAVTGEISVTESEYTCSYHFEAETGDGQELVFQDEGQKPKPIKEENLDQYVNFQVKDAGTVSMDKLKSDSETGSNAGNSDYPAKLTQENN